MNGELTIRLTNRALILVLGLLACAWLLLHVTHIFVVFFIAILLAAAVSTVARQLARLHIKRGVAILLTYLGIIAILAGVVGLIVPLVTDEVKLLRDNLPRYEQQANDFLARLPQRNGRPLQVNDLAGQAAGAVQGVALDAGRSLVDVGANLVTLLLIFVIAYFLAADERFAQRFVGRFFAPARRPRAQKVLAKMGDGLGVWVRAQLLLAIFFGLAFGIGLAVMGMPYALTLGVIGGVLEIIPYVGGFITILLAVLIAATTGKLWLIVAAIVWYTVVVNVEAHIVAPKLVGEIVGLHPLVIVIALFLGAEFLHVIGALLAVPIAVVIQTLLDEFYTFEESQPEAAAPAETAQLPPLQPGAGTARDG